MTSWPPPQAGDLPPRSSGLKKWQLALLVFVSGLLPVAFVASIVGMSISSPDMKTVGVQNMCDVPIDVDVNDSPDPPAGGYRYEFERVDPGGTSGQTFTEGITLIYVFVRDPVTEVIKTRIVPVYQLRKAPPSGPQFDGIVEATGALCPRA